MKNRLLSFVEHMKFRKYFYKKNQIAILWSMDDGNLEQMIKREALKSLSGIFVGSHWSLYPTNFPSIIKDYDILFTWGRYFIENLFEEINTKVNLITGFCSDHYFKNYKAKANDFKANYKNKFIIGYMDNAYGYDLFEYSLEINIKLYNMLIDLALNRENVFLIFKPKRRKDFYKIIEGIDNYPKLKKKRVGLKYFSGQKIN